MWLHGESHSEAALPTYSIWACSELWSLDDVWLSAAASGHGICLIRERERERERERQSERGHLRMFM